MNEGDQLDVSEKAAGSFTLEHAPAAKGTLLVDWHWYWTCPLHCHAGQNRDAVCLPQNRRCVWALVIWDLAYQDELPHYTSRNPGQFSYVPIVSREACTEGLSGRITTCTKTARWKTRRE